MSSDPSMCVSSCDEAGDLAIATAGEPDIRDHTVVLPGGKWRFWRQFVLRSAGFPASFVLELNADALAAADEDRVERTREVERRRTAAFQEVGRAFAAADPPERRTLRRRQRRILKSAASLGSGTESEAALAGAIEAEAAAAARYVAAFERAEAEVTGEIIRVSADPRFREAGLWQNHRAIGRIGQALRMSRGSDRRRAVDFVAMQIQRYAVKNDSIGFFGPIGWARLSEQPPPVDLLPGAGLIGRRETYFEGWCIDALAERFNEDAAVALWRCPRLAPGVWTDTLYAYRPALGIVPITPLQRRVLDLCDGRRTAADITAAMRASDPAVAAAQVLHVLQELVDVQLIARTIEVAPQLYPERALQTLLDAIGDPTLRARCAGMLSELVEARDRVGRAAGQPDELAVALDELDTTFVRLTGRQPARRAGEMYAARGLVYEDCARDCQLRLGQGFLDRLGPPLSLFLDGAHWAVAEFAAATRRHVRATYAELRRRIGSEDVDGHLFFSAVLRSGADIVTGPLRDVRRRVQAAWQSILQIDYEAARVTRSVEEVARRAREVFRTSGDLWSRGQYVSPDVMVAAPSLEAFRRGQFHGVLGEVHATNSLLWSSFVAQHPDSRTLVDALARDSGNRTMVFNPQQRDRWLARTALSLYPPTAWQYEWGSLPPQPGCRPAPAAMFVAIDDGRTIRMRARDGTLEFDALDLVGGFLSIHASNLLKDWLPDVAHNPRIAIGDLTIAREGWLVHPCEMPFLNEPNRAAQFAAVRAWARTRHLPRRVFYKSPAERKPCYLDFNSPVYVRLFVKLMRLLARDARVRIEEMLPDLEDLWLVDHAGARYTCEFRFAALPDEGASAAPVVHSC